MQSLLWLRTGDELGLQHFGLAMPTLEEVFLRVTSAAAADDPAIDLLATRPAATNPNTQSHAEASFTINTGSDIRTTSDLPMQPAGQVTGLKSQVMIDDRGTAAIPCDFKGTSPARSYSEGGVAGGEGDERTGYHRGMVAFREMMRKRALIASRDKKGAVFTLLLPVLAVAFVLVGKNLYAPRYGCKRCFLRASTD